MIYSRRYSGGVLVGLACLCILFLSSKHTTQSSLYYLWLEERQNNVQFDNIENQKLPKYGITKFNGTPPFQNVEIPGPPARKPGCDWVPDTTKVLLIMKTGASESYNKIPTQLITTLQCISDFLVFSDMKQSIGGVNIYDSLETVLQEAMEDNSDFDLYRRQRACAIDQESCNKEADGSSSVAGWNLDKYKNVHIAERAYAMRPDFDWYVSVDADTYVLWTNLLEWLSTLDPAENRYLGSVSMINDFPFGHGGSGYILSRAAMKNFVGTNPGVASNYDIPTKDSCCGDYMFAKALKDTTDIAVENVWPTINGEKPFTLPFGPTEWCHPIVSMHHMNSEEISNFWEFEKNFYESHKPGSNRTLLIKDIYKEFLEPRLEAEREDWDNLSEDVYYLDFTVREYEEWQLDRAKKHDLSDLEQNAHKSFDDCAKMCHNVNECFQFRFHNGICSYQRSFLFGRPKKGDDEKDQRWMSGWAVNKIKAWAEEHDECREILWPTLD